MRELLMILNPRSIAECVDSFKALDIDRLWIRRMTEATIAQRWDEIMDMTVGYDRLYMIGDDAIVRPHALDAVRQLLDDGHPVATGYSNLAANDFRVNLCWQQLPPQPDTALKLVELAEVMEYPEPVVPTTLCGYTITGMSRDMWLKYPFMIWWLGQSDFHFSKRLEGDGVPMVAAREAFVWHVKERWNLSDTDERKRPYVGAEPAELVLDQRDGGTKATARRGYPFLRAGVNP